MPSPLELTLDMQNKGIDEEKIASELSSKGLSNEQISQVMTQAKIKATVEPQEEAPPAPEAPSAQETTIQEFQNQQTNEPQQFQNYTTSTNKQVEEIAEEIIQEKWESFLESFGDLPIWKEKIENDILAIKQEIVRVHDRMNGVERALAGKVQEYSESLTDVTAEIKALSKLLQQILQPLTSNVKELQKITDKFKSKE